MNSKFIRILALSWDEMQFTLIKNVINPLLKFLMSFSYNEDICLNKWRQFK